VVASLARAGGRTTARGSDLDRYPGGERSAHGAGYLAAFQRRATLREVA
jgi:hypothetical protein